MEKPLHYHEIIEGLEAELMRHGIDEDLTDLRDEYFDLVDSDLHDPAWKAMCKEHIQMMIHNQYMSY
jgi:hypothetical protein